MIKKGHHKFWPWKWKYFRKNIIQKSWTAKILSVHPKLERQVSFPPHVHVKPRLEIFLSQSVPYIQTTGAYFSLYLLPLFHEPQALFLFFFISDLFLLLLSVILLSQLISPINSHLLHHLHRLSFLSEALERPVALQLIPTSNEWVFCLLYMYNRANHSAEPDLLSLVSVSAAHSLWLVRRLGMVSRLRCVWRQWPTRLYFSLVLRAHCLTEVGLGTLLSRLHWRDAI